MFDITLMALARALHILAGAAWMGAVLAMVRIIGPTLLEQKGTSPWFGGIARRIGPLAAGSSILTIVTGVYLFAVLHRHDTSAGGIVLASGALAGIVSAGFGIWIGRISRTQLPHLTGESGDAAQIAAARGHIMLAARVAAGLLVLSVLAMATFRYASAL